jgi:signal transduction histidine kinase
MIEMSSRGVSDPDEASLIADNLNLAIKRMTDVISSILDASHIDVESLDLNFIEAPLSNIVKLSIEPYADAIHERNLTLVARGLRNLPPIHADYQRMVQAIQNVVINAIKFTPDGGQITVTGDVFDKDGDGNPLSVKLAIQDSGVGINEEHHDLIFDKLYRIGPVSLHSTGTTKFKGAGPGLGLSISRGIIEGHGGRIWVESKGFSEDDLPGSTFYIILPVRPPVMLARQRIAQIQGGVDVSKDETVVMKRNKEG